MKKAFTMIELIFVIVILGILAAVAIPKFSATRDDAIITKTMDSVTVALNEIAGYAVSQGVVEDDLSLMSNALDKLERINMATLGIKTADIKAGKINDCLIVSVVTSGTDENVTIGFGTPGVDVLCNALQNKMINSVYSLPIRGHIAKF